MRPVSRQEASQKEIRMKRSVREGREARLTHKERLRVRQDKFRKYTGRKKIGKEAKNRETECQVGHPDGFWNR